jgi:hypothetical protein
MQLTYPKYLAIGYYSLSFLAVCAYSVGLISIFPIVIGLLIIALYFAVKAFGGFINKSDAPTIDFLVFYGMAMQLSLQTGMLVSHNYRSIMLYSSLIVFIVVLILIYRFKRQKIWIPLNIVIHLISFLIYIFIIN